MSELLRKSLILGLLVVGAIAALMFFAHAPTVSLESTHGSTEATSAFDGSRSSSQDFQPRRQASCTKSSAACRSRHSQ